MRHAIALARRGRGTTWPNPSVGCVIVSAGGVVVGRGMTARGGRPHAETIALEHAGLFAENSTAYVSLEPCAHRRSDGSLSCAESLIKAGVRRVVIGVRDPDPRVDGKGVRILEGAGVRVDFLPLEGGAKSVHSGFIDCISIGKPLITIKIATTHDGFAVMSKDHGRWITGIPARAHAHLERSFHDGVCAGMGTVRDDDPALNARVPGFAHATVRIILDNKGALSGEEQVFRDTGRFPLWCLGQARGGWAGGTGRKHIDVDTCDIQAVCLALAQEGLSAVLVEGGPALIRSWLESGLWDRFLWYKAPFSLGDNADIDPRFRLDPEEIQAKYALKHEKTRVLGEDHLEIYRKSA